LTWLADQQRLIYTPYPGFVGQDAFTYRVADGQDKSSPATVTLDVHENLTAVSVAIASDEED
jgi:hypothetical protein